MIKVLVVDDSAFMRKALSTLLEKDPDIKICGTATNGQEAVDLVPQLDPDVITMDIEMPRMDGLTALQHIMSKNPRPVLMVSSLTTEGAEVTLKALDYGAMDFIPKPKSTVSLDIIYLEKELAEKVKAVSRRRAFMRPLRSPLPQTAPKVPCPPATSLRPGPRPIPASSTSSTNTAPCVLNLPAGRSARDVLAIGVSTGGPPAVQKILSALPADFPVPIMIAQHMPAAFTGPFARRLDSLCAINVKEADHTERLKPGWAYISPGGKHIRLEQRGGLIVTVSEDPKEALYKPSANVLMESVGKTLGRRALGVILTGMGSDGLEGVRILKEKGGRALAQSESTCVVYGMPKAIVDAKLADEVVDLDQMAAAILQNLFK